MTTSEFMEKKDAQIMAENPSLPKFTHDSKITPKNISAKIDKENEISGKTTEERKASAFTAIKKALHLTKEEKAEPIAQPATTLKLEEINTGDAKETETPEIDGDER